MLGIEKMGSPMFISMYLVTQSISQLYRKPSWHESVLGTFKTGIIFRKCFIMSPQDVQDARTGSFMLASKILFVDFMFKEREIPDTL